MVKYMPVEFGKSFGRTWGADYKWNGSRRRWNGSQRALLMEMVKHCGIGVWRRRLLPVVMASQGHVRDLPKSQLGIDVEHDFEPKYITIRVREIFSHSFAKRSKRRTRFILRLTLTGKGKRFRGI